MPHPTPTRPDECWETAAEMLLSGQIGSGLQAVEFASHVGPVVGYVASKAVELARSEQILFGDSAEPIPESIQPLVSMPVGGILDGAIWKIIVSMLVDRAKDPSAMDVIAKWMANAIR